MITAIHLTTTTKYLTILDSAQRKRSSKITRLEGTGQLEHLLELPSRHALGKNVCAVLLSMNLGHLVDLLVTNFSDPILPQIKGSTNLGLGTRLSVLLKTV